MNRSLFAMVLSLLVVSTMLSTMMMYQVGLQGNADAAASHDEIACAKCHSMEAGSGTILDCMVSFAEAGQTCRSCHSVFATETADGRLSFHENTTRNCIECHNFHDPEVVVAGRASFAVDFRSDDHLDQCALCHSGGMSLHDLSESHRIASAVYHIDSERLDNMTISEACLTCHDQNSSGEVSSGIPADWPRLNVHASHPFGVDLFQFAGSGSFDLRVDPNIALFNGKIECATCHRMDSQGDDLLVANGDYEALCSSCHVRKQPASSTMALSN